MIIDSNLQSLPGWGTHTQADGSNIGGVPPKSYGFIQSPAGSPGAMLFYTSGSTVPGGYADWEAYLARPILPNKGNLAYSLFLSVDQNAANAAQAIETDVILWTGGYKYNFSLQNNYAEGGHIQIANASGGWVDTGFNPGKYALDTEISFEAAFNLATKTGGIRSISLDGQIFTVPAPLNNIAASKTPWPGEGVFVQIQLDLTAAAGAYSILINNAQLAWS